MRGVLPESYAINVMLYPDQSVGAAKYPEVSEQMVGITRRAFEGGHVGRLAARAYGVKEDVLEDGLQKVVELQRRILPLVPLKVHKLANIRERIIKLDRILSQISSERYGASHNQRRQLIQLRNAEVRMHVQIAKILNSDFSVDCQSLFSLTDNLIDEIVELFGADFEFLRRILAHYTGHEKADPQACGRRDTPERSSVEPRRDESVHDP